MARIRRMSAPEPEDLQAALAAVARAIADSLEVQDVWERVADACRMVVPFDSMGIVKLEPDGQVRAVGAAGLPGFKDLQGNLYPRSGFSERLWPDRDRFVVLVGDAQTELNLSYRFDRNLVANGYRSVLRVPLNHGGRRLGSVLLMSKQLHCYGENHARALLSIAELAALALVHEQLARTLAEETRRSVAAHERAERLEQRVQVLDAELQSLARHRALGTSRRWREVLAQADKVAVTETTVLLTGESGTGKEVVARFIQRASPRKSGPFVALNCAALAENLLESELFGHERGAFTGAHTARPGKIEQAAGGVLFLDEVAEMSPAVQAKFLRLLQEREYQRLGSTHVLKADVRVLAATNRDLKAAIARGTFREDLYYRLAVFDITLPALRERAEDVPVLAEAFLQELGLAMGHSITSIRADARTQLMSYPWPGNVRELRNVIERAVILCDGGEITPEHLPLSIAAGVPAAQPPRSAPALQTADAAERDLIVQALVRSGNNKSKAARLLGLTRAQLRSRIEKHQIP